MVYKKIILIVEDSLDNIQILNDILKEEYQLKIAKDGKKGLELYKQYNPSIIISDINMPIMTGIEMAEEIRKDDLNTKIIFISAHDEIEYLLKASSLKLTKYILKPLKTDDVIDAVETAKKELNSFNITSNKTFNYQNKIIWDFNNMTLKIEDKNIDLTPNEKKILNFLFLNINTVKTYDQIIYDMDEDFEMTKKSLLQAITTLRKKLTIDFIQNIYGIGYKISFS